MSAWLLYCRIAIAGHILLPAVLLYTYRFIYNYVHIVLYLYCYAVGRSPVCCTPYPLCTVCAVCALLLYSVWYLLCYVRTPSLLLYTHGAAVHRTSLRVLHTCIADLLLILYPTCYRCWRVAGAWKYNERFQGGLRDQESTQTWGVGWREGSTGSFYLMPGTLIVSGSVDLRSRWRYVCVYIPLYSSYSTIQLFSVRRRVEWNVVIYSVLN